MANRTYLLNTPTLTSDPYLLANKLSEPGNDHMEVAEAAYKIPVPWLCCFRAEDLRPVQIPYSENSGQANKVEVQLPCTSVTQELENVKAALPLFEQIAGDAKVGNAYWRNTNARLQSLPLPYLTMNVLELMAMNEIADFHAQLSAAMSGDSRAIPYLKELSAFEEGAIPYPPDVLAVVPNPHHNRSRMANAVALDIGYSNFWHLSAGSNAREDSFGSSYMVTPALDLIGISETINKLARGRAASARTTFGLIPVKGAAPEQLKLLMCTDSDAECEALRNDKWFRNELDGPIRADLESVCQAHGFTWLGYLFKSAETFKRQFNDDYHKYDTWISEPVEGKRPLSSMVSWLKNWQKK